NQAAELNREADELEEQAPSADPDHALELKRLVAAKRRKAKQYAANATALEISATKTRGPSLMALVDSGDLDLRGDAERRIRLKDKIGLAIAGLKPGATVDTTTPAAELLPDATSDAAS